MAFIKGSAAPSAIPDPERSQVKGKHDPASAEPPVRRRRRKRVEIELEPSASAEFDTTDKRSAIDDVPKSDGGHLVSLTTRLRKRTVDRLRRLCLEQKLAGRKPDSLQEVIEQAVIVWLRNRP